MKIAIYIRLSRADDDLDYDNKDESNSIENQRKLLEDFINAEESLEGEIVEYVDDGYSGTNFDRPGFKKLISDCKKRLIKTVVVKDLSRLGRDYIDVGDYLEQIFPVMGVRVIAIHSNYDSNNYIGNTMDLEMSITNLVNTLYVRDISKKYRSCLRTKWKQGVTTCGRPPYGYKKSENKEWIIDEPAAKNVRFIFEKARQGWSTNMIASRLNELEVLTPGQYRELGRNWNKVVTDNEWLWDTHKVWDILKNYSYTGALVHGKTVLISVGSKSRRNADPTEIFIKENVHIPIVSKEEFEEAQLIFPNKGKRGIVRDAGFSLRGKIKCGNCNLNMGYDAKGTGKIYCAHTIMNP